MSAPIGGPYRRRQAVVGVVRPNQRLGFILERRDGHHRAEDLAAHHLILLRSAGQDRRLEEEAGTSARLPPVTTSMCGNSLARFTNPSTRSRCSLVISGPISVAGSSGSPHRMLDTASPSLRTNSW